MGTAKQARTAAGGRVKAAATLRKWAQDGLVYAVRVGGGPYLYDLDDVAKVAAGYPVADGAIDERIRELVAAAPELSARQISRIKLLLQTGAPGVPHASTADAARL
jgi:hypothetical protein